MNKMANVPKTFHERVSELLASKAILEDSARGISENWALHQSNVIATELRKLFYKSKSNTPLFLDLMAVSDFDPTIHGIFIPDEIINSSLMDGMVFYMPGNMNQIVSIERLEGMRPVRLSEYFSKIILILDGKRFRTIDVIRYIANQYWAHSDTETSPEVALLRDLKFWDHEGMSEYFHLIFFNLANVIPILMERFEEHVKMRGLI